MKIRIFIVAITVIVLTALSAAGFFIYKSLARPEIPKEESPVITDEVSSSTDAEKNPALENKEVLEETRLVKDDFEITLPPGWQEATSTYEGILLLAFDAKEDISGGKFQTNLSIKSDDLNKYSSLDTLEKYVESIKVSLVQLISGIKFNFEEPRTVDGHNAVFIECESNQDEGDFKTLLVFIEGDNKVIYALSFNTFQNSWPDYKNLFYQITDSFKLRYNI